MTQVEMKPDHIKPNYMALAYLTIAEGAMMRGINQLCNLEYDNEVLLLANKTLATLHEALRKQRKVTGE